MKFNIFHHEYNGDAPMEREGRDHEDAAERYAEDYDVDDYPLTSGESALIRVVDEHGVEKSYKIYASISTDYYADEIADKLEGK